MSFMGGMMGVWREPVDKAVPAAAKYEDCDFGGGGIGRDRQA